MKRTLIAFIILVMASIMALAVEDVWLSSHTATADTTKNLCLPTISGQLPRSILHGVCINTGVAGTLTIYASSGSAINPIAAVNTSTTMPCSLYDVASSSIGLTYTNSATADVTILYQCW